MTPFNLEPKDAHRKGGKGKKRSKKGEKPPELASSSNERWLVSYADFITLLFTFFVALYAISRVDNAKLAAAAGSLQRVLSSVEISGDLQSGTETLSGEDDLLKNEEPGGEEGYPEEERKNFEKVIALIQNRISSRTKGRASGSPGNEMKFILEKRGLVIRVSERLIFKSGEASIPSENLPTLDILGKAFESVPNTIRIEGHTDNVPINTAAFPSNWELSTARATNVLRYLITHFKLAPDHLSATGFAEFCPILPNKTVEGRFQNRRVDFVLLADKADSI